MPDPLRASDALPAAFADATVLDLEGAPTPLRALWAAGPAVIVWIRHYG